MVGDDDFYRSDLSDLHKEVAPEILPKDLGWGHDHKEEQYYCYYAYMLQKQHISMTRIMRRV